MATHAHVARSSGCRVSLRSGAFALACVNFAAALDTITDGDDDDDTQMTAKLVLRGGVLTGTGLLSAAKPFNATRDASTDDYEYTYDNSYN